MFKISTEYSEVPAGLSHRLSLTGLQARFLGPESSHSRIFLGWFSGVFFLTQKSYKNHQSESDDLSCMRYGHV